MWNRAEIARRRQLLLAWLGPAGGDPEAGRLVGRPHREIAQALRSAFPDKSIGTTSVQRFLADLRRDGRQPELGTLKRGRPKAPELPPDAVPDAHIWREALSLTGLDRLALYRLLNASAGAGLAVPNRSSFYAQLSRVPMPAERVVARAGNPDGYRAEEHVLRLHQIDLTGPTGDVRSVALAYDVRTRYVCARLCVFARADAARRRGRPAQHFQGGPQPDVLVVSPAPRVSFPAAWWRDFAEEVAARMKLPLAGLVLSGGVCGAVDLVAGLVDLQPDGGYEAIETGPQVLSHHAGERMSDAQFGAVLAAVINRYNQAVSLPLIDKARRRLADLSRRKLTSSRDLFLNEMSAALSFDSEQFRAAKAHNAFVRVEDQLAQQVKARLALEHWQPFKGTYVTCKPLRYLRGSPKKV